MINWHLAAAVFLLSADLLGASLLESFLQNTPDQTLIAKTLKKIAKNRGFLIKKEKDGDLSQTKNGGITSLLSAFPTDDTQSLSKISGKKKSRLKMFSSLLKDDEKKELMGSAVKSSFKVLKKFMKREVARAPTIDGKYKVQIVEHCGDLKSFYFPELDECYRIYRTPQNNLDPNYGGERNELAYGSSKYDYMYNCWELYFGKLLDIGEKAIAEKMQLVRQMVLQFYQETGQQGAIQVGFMINKNYELMAQNGTVYDTLDGVYVSMSTTEPCDSVCCVNIQLAGENAVEMVQASCESAKAPNFFCQRRGNN